MLLLPKPAAAQAQSYYTYVSEWAVPRAQWAAFEKQDEASVAKMKQAVANGLLVAWGNEEVRCIRTMVTLTLSGLRQPAARIS